MLNVYVRTQVKCAGGRTDMVGVKFELQCAMHCA